MVAVDSGPGKYRRVILPASLLALALRLVDKKNDFAVSSTDEVLFRGLTVLDRTLLFRGYLWRLEVDEPTNGPNTVERLDLIDTRALVHRYRASEHSKPFAE